jgi:hypothetical protein
MKVKELSLTGIMTRDSFPNSTPRTFGELMLKSFWASYGPITAFIGLLLAIVGLIWIPKDVQLSLRILIVPALLCLYMIMWLGQPY